MSAEWYHLQTIIFGAYRSHIADTAVDPVFNIKAHHTKLKFVLILHVSVEQIASCYQDSL